MCLTLKTKNLLALNFILHSPNIYSIQIENRKIKHRNER